MNTLERLRAAYNPDSETLQTVEDLLRAVKEYRRVCGWSGDRIKERAALQLDAALEFFKDEPA